MSWFFFALISPLMYAACNQIDKALLEKYFKTGGVGTLLLFSSLLSILLLPIIYLFDPTVFTIGNTEKLILASVGLMNIILLWSYLTALEEDEASIIIVFYQLVPVFGLVLGYYILGETVTTMQIVAMAIVILGTSLISFEVNDENNFKLKRKTVFLMLIATLMWALESVVFKAVALEENVLRSLFWEHLSLVVAGILIFGLIPKYRNHFLEALQKNSKPILGVNVLNESLYIGATVIYSFAFMMAPIALVLLTNSFQPIFVFAIGVFMTLYFPKIITEKISAKHLWQKLIAIIITGIGTSILFLS